jgi:hypothetical protein
MRGSPPTRGRGHHRWELVPLIEPNSGPNFAGFDDEASYYINVDNVRR